MISSSGYRFRVRSEQFTGTKENYELGLGSAEILKSPVQLKNVLFGALEDEVALSDPLSVEVSESVKLSQILFMTYLPELSVEYLRY